MHPQPQPLALSPSSRRALSLLIGLLVAASTTFVFLLSASSGGLPRHQGAPPFLQDFYINLRNDVEESASVGQSPPPKHPEAAATTTTTAPAHHHSEHQRRHQRNRESSAVDEGTAAVDLFAPEVLSSPPQPKPKLKLKPESQQAQDAAAAAAAALDAGEMQQALASSQEDLGLAAVARAPRKEQLQHDEEVVVASSRVVVVEWDGRGWDDDDDDRDERDEREVAVDAHKEEEKDEEQKAVADAEPTVGGDGRDLTVYMDFAQSRSTWGKAQHRALESLLTRYPEAKVVVLQVAPGSYANYHYADALGITHFQKYRKRG